MACFHFTSVARSLLSDRLALWQVVDASRTLACCVVDEISLKWAFSLMFRPAWSICCCCSIVSFTLPKCRPAFLSSFTPWHYRVITHFVRPCSYKLQRTSRTTARPTYIFSARIHAVTRSTHNSSFCHNMLVSWHCLVTFR